MGQKCQSQYVTMCKGTQHIGTIKSHTARQVKEPAEAAFEYGSLDLILRDTTYVLIKQDLAVRRGAERS